MRDIKFRGYAVEELVGAQWLTDGFGVSKIEYTNGTNSVYLSTPFGDYKVFEKSIGQYTGLKDKNGVEIYEGDIVRTYERSLEQVIWQDNGFKFLYKFNIRGYDEKTILDLGDTSSRRWGVEVIGNIYENSELLEVK